MTTRASNRDTRLLARMPGRTSKKLAGLERNRSPQDHASRLQKMGERLRQKRYRRLATTTRFPLLRHVLNVAVEAGVVYSNAAAAVKRAPVRCKEIKLPRIDKFNALIAEMRAGHSRDSINCADFASGLAFTGCRISEAREIAWRDVDFDAGEIVVRGDATTGTKNWELRRVPLIPDARALFERMRSERHGESLDAKVFRVGECQKGA